MTAKLKNDPEGLQQDGCGYLNVKPAISKVGFLKNRSVVTLGGTNISPVFVLHRVVPR